MHTRVIMHDSNYSYVEIAGIAQPYCRLHDQLSWVYI